MAKLDLKENEKLIADAQASHVKKMLFIPQANPGKLYVTDKRVIFEPTQGRASSAFEHNLDEIESFSVGMAKSINIVLKSGENHKITGMFNKKLIAAMEEVKIKRVEK